MSDDEMGDAMEGLFAYDTGCTDSGIHDDALREKVKAWLQAVDEKWLSRWVREAYLSERALEQGYGIGDVAEFFKWLGDWMDCDV